jgi:hypothetical protein
MGYMDDARVAQLLENRLTIDCPNIILRQEILGSDKKEYAGPGTIIQNEGTFVFKLFPKKMPAIQDLFSGFFNVEPGKILDDLHYFHLSATDLVGVVWEADRVRLHFDADMSRSTCLAYGKCRQLRCKNAFPIPKQKKDLLIIFPGNIEIPCNAPVETVKQICGKDRKRSSVLNVAMVQAAGFEFELERGDKWLSVSALSDSIITQSRTVRILEALQFVLGQTLHWCVMEVNQEGKLETTIRAPSTNEVRSSSYPPISFSTINNAVWELFKMYLEHYISFEEETWHPTFSSIYRILQASAAPLSTEALSLSVAVEGILKSEFNNVGKSSQRWDRVVEQAEEMLNSAMIDLDVKKRLSSALGQMKNPRAKDRLYALSNEGLICERHVKAWEKLRNSTAHADELEEEKLQKFLNRLYSAYVLFHQLIFLTIGYTGTYTDYSGRFGEKEFAN